MPAPSPVPPAPWRRGLRLAEDLLVIVPLTLSILLPVLEVILRRFHTGITGSINLVQNLTLIIGMAGAAIAARENRLLSFSTLSSFVHGRARAAALVVSSGTAAAISAVLCAASWQFMLSEKQGGGALVQGLPDWVVELVLPLGFGLIAVRLVWHAADRWPRRLATLALAAAIIAFGVFSPVDPARCVLPGLVALLAATILGAPVFTAIGGAALILFWGDGSPLATIPLKHHSLVTSSSLPTIPLFTLAGYFLAESGASARLIRVFQALVGSFRGGPGIAATLLCAFFTTFTGASGVTILALGGLLMPVLRSARYSERDSLGLLTGAGSLGLLFPPCLPVILYAIIAGTAVANLNVANVGASSITMEKMFLGGLLPGVLMIVLAAWWAVLRQPRTADAQRPFDGAEAGRALWAAKWELLLPVVALLALFSGWATPIEASAITAAYALIITTVVHRDLHPLRDLPRVMVECGLLVGGVLVILGVAMGFTHYLVLAQIPDWLVDWTTRTVKSKWLFLLGLNAVLLVVGGLIEIYAAIVVVVPLLVPVGLAFGIDPVHLGIIFLANMQLGFLFPPVGLNLLLASYRFNKPMTEVMRAVIPMLLVLGIGVLLITYFPPLTTFVPGLFH